ncbi:uncharacterized protein DNG_08132 [Cephalotrichum gorgonifer]|uniref:Uncharacterized protein n=1 Tax=Cephalotrichum gorgonifer TaxID=2041049 RepID=A0AAE8SY25_9PEZI|nr:uncharacterized protein DNG_08132 [Cephalotrichum gorgonifer]
MCYSVITHSLECDARPVINDGYGEIVNGYADPSPCCDTGSRNTFFSNIPSAMRCPSHGCCVVTTSFRPCTVRYLCDEPVQFHLYNRVGRPGVQWRPLPVLDWTFQSPPADKFFYPRVEPVPYESPEWRYALQILTEAGEVIRDLKKVTARVRDAIREKSWAHIREHGCCYFRECPLVKELSRLQGEKMELARARAGIMGKFAYAKWMVCHGGLEGGRAVSGLEMQSPDNPSEDEGGC